ncbi:uncharacterized protein LOC134233609 [Saccostrea cucullata]|uniref:uncharacterized protein LOC134233609 n=1 Tax=Saccostrea cuccullata TaxID=36930 RepID=UPI002ED29042
MTTFPRNEIKMSAKHACHIDRVKGIFSKSWNLCFFFIIMTSLTCVLPFQFRHNRAARTPCLESSKTLREVQNCPTNKDTWEERSRLMDCGNIQHNCSETSLVYHCLLDQYGRGLMEVCALSTEIIGRRCAEYNTGAMIIQEHFAKRCRMCPFAYNSNVGYLYGECFQVDERELTTESATIKQHSSTLSLVMSSTFSERNSSSNTEHIDVTEENFVSMITPIIIGLILPVLCITCTALVNVLISFKPKELTSSERENEDFIELTPLMMGNMQKTVSEVSDEDVIQQWKEEDSYFFETKSFSAMMEKVQKKSYMTFVGVAGSGRSATVRHIALKFQDEGYKIVPVQDIRDLQLQFFDIHKPQIFIIDDVVGDSGLHREKLTCLLECEERITNPRLTKSKVLMTFREDVFDKCCKSFFTSEQHVIRLQTEETLTDDDKREILEKHGLDRDLLSFSSLRKSFDMFHLLCKLYLKEDTFRAYGEIFFISPLQCISRELDKMSIENNVWYAALVLCVFNNDKLSEEILEIESNKDFQEMKLTVLKKCEIEIDPKEIKFVNALSAMDGTYTKKYGKDYIIIHDLIFDVIACHFGSKFPELILRYMSTSYIVHNVKTISPWNPKKVKVVDVSNQIKDERKKYTEHTCSLRLHSKYYPLLAERLYEDLKKMELQDIFGSDILKHPDVCQALLEVLKKDSFEKIKSVFLSEHEDATKLEIRWRDAGRDISERTKDLRKQQLLLNKKLIGYKIVNSVRGISWVILYGHYQILRYIVEETEKHRKTETELFQEFAEEYNFSKPKETGTNDETTFDLSFSTKEDETIEKSEREDNQNKFSIVCERTRLLILGCYSGDLETVKILLKYIDKESLNTPLPFPNDISDAWYWDTPLTAACDSGKTPIVEELLLIGANVNQVGKLVTPLISACQGGYLDIIEILLKFGADVNLPGAFDIPLTSACRSGHVKVMKILLTNGANVNQQGKCDTPLTAACKKGHLDLVQQLIEAGADVNLYDQSNESPLTTAYNGGHDKIVLELRNYGADYYLPKAPCMYNEEEISVANDIIMVDGFDIR